MKQKFFCKTTILFIASILMASSSVAQKQFSVTSNKTNNNCNGTCTLFDNAELNGNPTAVIFVTPINVNGVNLDPHPICAYYNGRQWSVMNTDNSTIPVGAQFTVQYYATADDKNFVHIITKDNSIKNNSYIDHQGLNGNPKATFQFFQNAAPAVRGGFVNKDEVGFQYDQVAGKWFITNNRGTPIPIATGYNIAISSEVEANINTVITPPVNTTPFTPGPKNDNSGQRVFVTVMGKKQGQFVGENNSNRMEIYSFEMEVVSLESLSFGQAIIKRQHLPMLFEKNTGPASMQFYNAIATSEQLTTVTFEVYKTAADGTYKLDYKMILTNARITGFKQTFKDGKNGFVDAILLTAQKFELTIGSLTASDTITIL